MSPAPSIIQARLKTGGRTKKPFVGCCRIAKDPLSYTRINQRHVYSFVEASSRSLSLNSIPHLLTWTFITMSLPKV
jgi:hypothetical protein